MRTYFSDQLNSRLIVASDKMSGGITIRYNRKRLLLWISILSLIVITTGALFWRTHTLLTGKMVIVETRRESMNIMSDGLEKQLNHLRKIDNKINSIFEESNTIQSISLPSHK